MVLPSRVALMILMSCPGGFAVAGLLAGAGARRLIGRLRRGAVVAPPWCEITVALAWAATGGAWAAGALPGSWVPALLGLGWLGAALGAVDVIRRCLPDALTLPALPAALVLLTPLGPGAVLRGLGGAGIAAGVHALVRWCAPRALGGGDVKLAAPLGAILAAASWAALAPALLLASLCTGVAAALGIALRRIGHADGVPHGPSMLLATWLVATVAAAGG